MADTDDPLFIVPAVLPDEEPSPKTTERPSNSSAFTTKKPARPRISAAPTGATTEVVAISDEGGSPTLSDQNRRTIRFERPAVRRTTRTVRYIDPLSVFRVVLLAHFVLYIVLLLAGVLLWNVANATGTVDNVERFMESFGWETFEFNGGELFHQAWILGLFAVAGLTGLAVLAVTTFNLITDLVGGIRLTVVESHHSRRSSEGKGPGEESPSSPRIRRGG